MKGPGLTTWRLMSSLYPQKRWWQYRFTRSVLSIWLGSALEVLHRWTMWGSSVSMAHQWMPRHLVWCGFSDVDTCVTRMEWRPPNSFHISHQTIKPSGHYQLGIDLNCWLRPCLCYRLCWQNLRHSRVWNNTPLSNINFTSLSGNVHSAMSAEELFPPT